MYAKLLSTITGSQWNRIANIGYHLYWVFYATGLLFVFFQLVFNYDFFNYSFGRKLSICTPGYSNAGSLCCFKTIFGVSKQTIHCWFKIVNKVLKRRVFIVTINFMFNSTHFCAILQFFLLYFNWKRTLRFLTPLMQNFLDSQLHVCIVSSILKSENLSGFVKIWNSFFISSTCFSINTFFNYWKILMEENGQLQLSHIQGYSNAVLVVLRQYSVFQGKQTIFLLIGWH